MKLFAKLMLALLVIALLLPFTVLKNDSGKTLMSFSDFKFKMPDFSMPSFSAPSVSGSNRVDGEDIFYKWHDSDGNVQFTTEPPPEGIEYTIKGYDPNTNVIQAVKLPEQDSGKSPEPGNGKNKDDTEPSLTGSPYNPEKIEKLMEDAKNIEKLLNQRFQDQNSALNQ